MLFILPQVLETTCDHFHGIFVEHYIFYKIGYIKLGL